MGWRYRRDAGAEHVLWGAQSLSVFTNNALYFEHQDWLGSKRLLSAPDGTQAEAYGALPFGDDQAVSGADVDPLHYAGLDHDYESGLDHAQYREYSSGQAHWMSPDPYRGSYDWANPQSLNRYSYALNDPLSFVDPTGLSCTDSVGTYGTGADGGTVIDGNCFPGGGGDGGLISDLVNFGEFLAGLFGGPHFHGSLQPRPAIPSNLHCPSRLAQRAYKTAISASPAFSAASAYAQVTQITTIVGASASGTLGVPLLGGFGGSGAGQVAVAFDRYGNAAFTSSYGFGPGYGLGGVVGADFGLSKANTVFDLAGPSPSLSIGGGDGLAVNVTASSNAGGTGTITVGAGGGGYGGALTGGPTAVIPLICQ